jgi:VWFA-related protein
MVRILLVGAASALLVAQGQERPTFKSATRTVHVYATVQGRDGRLVPDLTRDDFQIFDNSRRQPITVFDNTPQTITLAAMFDMSGSMADDHPRVKAAAEALVKALWPDDRAAIGSFGMEVAISPFLTSDKAALLRVVDEELWPGGATPLWYATDIAMSALKAEAGRRVVLLFTDGDDSGVFVPGSQSGVRRRAEREEFMVYVVGLPGRGLHDDVVSLADDSGGGHFLVGHGDDLGATFARVVEELHHQYVLGFSIDALDGRSHSLAVKTTRPGAKVRARKSYVAALDAPGAAR